jgi:N-acetyl-gamma-glutamyl-phosphate reductase
MHTVNSPVSVPGTTKPPARVAIVGVTGYAGQELLRLLARHPAVTVTAAMDLPSETGPIAKRLPALARQWNGDVTPLDPAVLAQADFAFLALPESVSAQLAPGLVDAGVRVVDISGAFRLRDGAVRQRWYPETGRIPEHVAYGLTERERDAVLGARLVANAGCYPTATLLALAPLASDGLLSPGTDIVVDAKSAVSGAGKSPNARTHFSECHGSVSAYGVFGHRHAAEIEQGVDASHSLTFVPHLVPLNRGILATIYVRLAPGTTEEAVGDLFGRAYGNATFVRLVGSALPAIKQVAYTNFCDIGWRVDPSGRAVIVSVIDNLIKGAAGQAVQNMNVMLGIDEGTGLL